ncbi:MAG TPA: hypothetical protein VFP65_21205, partial [Anaeromyxobacteraceae bacterium]|nr:hypothetical protein [Anaeromyxobacteraceae bacterium]
PDEALLRRDRARYLAEARALAARLRARWASEPPAWNPGSGDPELDRLTWFRYVEQERLRLSDPP